MSRKWPSTTSTAGRVPDHQIGTQLPPSALVLLDGLIEVCDRMRGELQQRLSDNQQQALGLAIPPETKAGQSLAALSADTTEEAIRQATRPDPDAATNTQRQRARWHAWKPVTPQKERVRLQSWHAPQHSWPTISAQWPPNWTHRRSRQLAKRNGPPQLLAKPCNWPPTPTLVVSHCPSAVKLGERSGWLPATTRSPTPTRTMNFRPPTTRPTARFANSVSNRRPLTACGASTSS